MYCTCGFGLHVGLNACHTCCVPGMRYYVCVLCSYGVMTCILVVFYSMWVHVSGGIVHQVWMYKLCFISGVCVCIFWHCTLRADVCLVKYIMYIYMLCCLVL